MNRTTTLPIAILAMFAAACGKSPTAMSVCEQLAAGGVASNCHAGTPTGLGVGAAEDAEFDLPSVPGKGGMVLRFDKEDVYDKTVEAFSKAAMLSVPHRYGSRTTRIFVQMNNKATANVGAKAKSVVDALPGNDTSPPVSKDAPPAESIAPAASAAPIASAAPVTMSSEDVCKKLVAAIIAKNCTKTETGQKFEVLGLPAGKNGGSVTVVADEATFGKFLASYEASPPTSPLRPFYSSQKANVIVSFPKGMPAPTEARAKATVEGL